MNDSSNTLASGIVGPQLEAFGMTHEAPSYELDAPIINLITAEGGNAPGFVGSNASTDTSRLIIGGFAEPGTTVLVYDNGTLLQSVEVNDQGHWSFRVETELANGKHSLVAKLDGGLSPDSIAFPFSIDTSMSPPSIEHVLDHTGGVAADVIDGTPTADNKPTLTGTTIANANVIIYDNGHVIGTVQANNAGSWQFTPKEALANGEHSFTTSLTHGTPGNPVLVDVEHGAPTPIMPTPIMPTLTIDFLRDDVGVSQGHVSSGAHTDDSRPLISGTGPANTLVSIHDGNTVIGTVLSDSTGAWSLSPNAALAAGTHSLTAITANGDASAAFVVTVDSNIVVATPTIASVYDDAGASQGFLGNGAHTDDRRPQLTGTAQAYAVVTIHDGDTVLGIALSDGNGAWRFTPNTDLADGVHALTASTANSAASAAFTITLDSAVVEVPAPTIAYVYDDVGGAGYLQNGGHTQDSRPLLIGTAQANTLVTIHDGNTVVGTVLSDGSGVWRFTPDAALADGTHNLIATTANSAASTAFTVTVDSPVVAPAPTLNYVYDGAGTSQGYLANGAHTDETRPLLIGTAQANTLVTIHDGNTVVGTVLSDGSGVWRFTPDTALADGSHSLTATTQNSAPSQPFSLVVDTANHAPVIVSVSDHVGASQGDLSNGAVTDDKAPLFSGTANANALVTLYDGNQRIGETHADNTGHWSMSPFGGLSDGTHAFTVGVDGSGQSNPFVVTVNTAVPFSINFAYDAAGAEQGRIENNATTDDARAVLYGTAEAGKIIYVYDGDHYLGMTLSDPQGNWTYKPGQALSNGEHSFTATLKDGSATTAPFDLNVQTPEPPATRSVLSLSDVLGHDHADLFAVTPDHDTAQLNVHDVVNTSPDLPQASVTTTALHVSAEHVATLLPQENVHHAM